MISYGLPGIKSSTTAICWNCCTMVDKIHSKTEVSLIQSSWNLYRILHHKSRECIPNFRPIQIDLVTQTQTWSQLAQIFNLGQISITWAILYQMWIKLETNLFEYFHKTYIHLIHLIVISWIYPTQINPNLITEHLSTQTLIASNIAYLSNSINSYAPKRNDQQGIYLG